MQPVEQASHGPATMRVLRDWDGIAHAAVGSLRAEAGRDPHDRALTDLVGELSMRSEEFRVRWAAHDVEHQPSARRHQCPSSPSSRPQRVRPNVHRGRLDRRHRPWRSTLTRACQHRPVHTLCPHRLALPRRWADPPRHRHTRPGSTRLAARPRALDRANPRYPEAGAPRREHRRSRAPRRRSRSRAPGIPNTSSD
jgi:hypothetical protein